MKILTLLAMIFLCSCTNNIRTQNELALPGPDHCYEAGVFRIYFSPLQDSLGVEDEVRLQRIISAAHENPGPILIISRAEQGERAIRPNLAADRAETVRRHLLESGLDQNRIFARGQETLTIASATNSSSAHDRRTDIILRSAYEFCTIRRLGMQLDWLFARCLPDTSNSRNEVCRSVIEQIRRTYRDI